MVQLTFFGGVGEIGGNKVLLETKGARIFLDFGQSFTFEERYFAGYLRPRGLFDYLRLGLLDPTPGLYNKDSCEDAGLPYAEDPAFAAVVLTHVHFDHVAHLKYLHEKIPVHLGATTSCMLGSWQTCSAFAKFGEHPYQTFRTGDTFMVGDVKVEPIHVDHSTPAAYGLILHTPDGAVAYTGDLRRHGPMAHYTQDFIEKARDSRPIALICEGTRVAPKDPRHELSEKGVFDAVDALIVKNPNKLVATTFYERDIDRIKTYHALATKHGRKFAVSARVAHMLNALQSESPHIQVPNPHTDANMAIYLREKKRYYKWEQEVQGRGGLIVGSDAIHNHQNEYILHLDFNQFTEFLDIDPAPGSLYINSMSEPFSEYDVEDEVKDNWLNFLQMERHQAHASGHAPMKDIFAIANEIAPKVFMPVHTEHPEMFSGNVKSQVILPERGKLTVI